MLSSGCRFVKQRQLHQAKPNEVMKHFEMYLNTARPFAYFQLHPLVNSTVEKRIDSPKLAREENRKKGRTTKLTIVISIV
jgi:hypothetical protein